jgi:hypothetical protein
MLQSGIKASMAVRIYGDSLEGLGKASLQGGGTLSRSTTMSIPVRLTPTSSWENRTTSSK